MMDTWARMSRRTVKMLLDAGALFVAFTVALLARFDFDATAASEWYRGLVVLLGLAVVLQVLLGRWWGLYTGRWHFGSFEEFAALVATCSCLTFSLVIVDIIATDERRLLPLGAVGGAGAAALILMAGTRYVWRAFDEYRSLRRGSSGRRVLIAGAGAAGRIVAREMRTNPSHGFTPVGFLDDDPLKQNLRPAGFKVLGTTYDVARVAAETEADSLLIAMPSVGPETVDRLTELGSEIGLQVQIVPHVLATVNGSVRLEDIREVRIEDLLGRDPVRTDTASVAQYLATRTVLVTGAGGSIGEELCRQVQGLNPDRVVLLDHDETNLHRLELSLRGEALLQTPSVVIADIRDRDRVRDVFERWKPDVVFHAAAHKHLPLLELHPSEGVKTNVTGTLNVAEAAIEFGTQRFIFISTDKAARPESVLGATKRVGEIIVQQLGLDCQTIFAAVRFGNVLGSRGSVVSVFEEQIASGHPLTVTHPDVTRYFMTIHEACQLVIQAAAYARGGEIFVLDMGTPVKIQELARRMARLARPNEEVAIRFTGLRPGEKMHEDLFFEEEARIRSPHPKIFVGQTQPTASVSFWAMLRKLIDASDRNDDQTVRDLLSELSSNAPLVRQGEGLLGELYPDGL